MNKLILAVSIAGLAAGCVPAGTGYYAGAGPVVVDAPVTYSYGTHRYGAYGYGRPGWAPLYGRHRHPYHAGRPWRHHRYYRY